MSSTNALWLVCLGCSGLCALWSAPHDALSGSAAAVNPPVKITMRPPRLPIGGMAVLHLEPAEGYSLQTTRFMGRSIPFHPDQEKGGFWALIGAGLATSPGRHVLSVQTEGPGGSELHVREIQVLARTFPEERLTVPERMVELPANVLRRVRQDQDVVRSTCAQVSSTVLWGEPFKWPVPSTVRSPFGLRRVLNDKPRSPHSGMDLRAAVGTPVRASNNGRVVLVRDCYLSGKTMILDHGAGLFSLYTHLSAFRSREGERVLRDQVIGLAGSSGRATGPHLHWGINLLGERVDPKELMVLLGEDSATSREHGSPKKPLGE
jgi:hypothetical protein